MSESVDSVPPSPVSRQRYSTSHRLAYSTTESLPPGAVLLTKDQIHSVQMKAIRDWKPAREMWPLTYGPHFLGAMAALNGVFFISHFRRAMVLRSHARMATVIPSVFFPGVVTSVAHQIFVVHPMSTGSIVCPVCLELRGLAIQAGVGVAQPFILALVASAAIARTAQTFPLPPVSDPRALLSAFARLIRPIRLNILSLIVMNLAGVAVMTYAQGRASERLHESIVKDKVTFVS